MPLTEEQRKERRKEASRKYYQKNKEKNREASRKNYQANKERKREANRKYRKENKDKIKEYREKYREENPEKLHMLYTIGSWKSRGLIDDDYEKLYHLVMSQKICWRCNCILTIDKVRTSTTRCMDHDHDTGKFRGVVCQACNVKGGYKGGDC